MCEREREKERQRRSVSAEQTLQQTAKSGVSTWAPQIPSPQLFVLVQPLACVLAHRSTRTWSETSLSGRSLGACCSLPCLSTEGHLQCASPHHPETIACPPAPTHHHVPALSNLAGSTEMSASPAPSGPTPAGYIGAKHQAVSVSGVLKSPLHASATVHTQMTRCSLS